MNLNDYHQSRSEAFQTRHEEILDSPPWRDIAEWTDAFNDLETLCRLIHDGKMGEARDYVYALLDQYAEFDANRAADEFMDGKDLMDGYDRRQA